jgi:hypothetical protein
MTLKSTFAVDAWVCKISARSGGRDVGGATRGNWEGKRAGSSAMMTSESVMNLPFT